MKDDGIVDTDRDVTVGDTDCDVTVGYSNCDVTVSDNEPADVPKCDPMNLFARNRPDPVFTDDDEYQIERTLGVINLKWRIRCHSYPINNRGFGQHDAVLQQMTQGDERDKHLMQVLSHVVSQSTAVSQVCKMMMISMLRKRITKKKVMVNQVTVMKSLVNATSDNPLQNYEPVTLKLLDADDDLPIKKEQIDEPSTVLQEVKVHVQSGTKQGVEIIEISSESDNVVSSDHNTCDKEEKVHEKDTEKRKPDEKCDVITDDDNEKSDVLEDVGEKHDVITKEKDAEKHDVPDEVGKSGVGKKWDVITEEKDDEKCDVPDDVGNSDVGEKHDGKYTEKSKPDEEVGKGNVVKKNDGITNNDNKKSYVPGVGDKGDVITEEKDAEKHDVPDDVGNSDVGKKHDGKDTEKSKPDEEVGKGNVVKKNDGITNNDNEKSYVPGVGDNGDVITEEKDDEKCNVPPEVGNGNVEKDTEDMDSDVGNKDMEILDAADKKDVGKSMVTHEEDTEKHEEVRKADVKKDSEDVENDVGNKSMEILDGADKKDVGKSMVTHVEDNEKCKEVRKADVCEKCHGITDEEVQSDVGNKSMEILDAADKKDVGKSMGTKENNKEPNVDTSAGPDSQLKPIVITLEKCDVITEQVQVEEDKCDVSESEERDVIKEKCDVMTPATAEENESKNITKPDDSCSSRAEKKTGSSDS